VKNVIDDPIRVLRWSPAEAEKLGTEAPEWLMTNGLGGYACGTVTGLLTRRYHGLLIAALPIPLGRTVMLDLLVETLHLADAGSLQLGVQQIATEDAHPDHGHLVEFRLEQGLPVWRFEAHGIVIERQAMLLHRQNTVVLGWRLFDGADSAKLQLRPFVHFRAHDARVSDDSGRVYRLFAVGEHYEISAGTDIPPLRLLVRGPDAALTLDGGMRHELFYAAEARRGYDSRGNPWSPGYFSVDLHPDREAWLIASTEAWDEVTALRPIDAVRRERARRRELIRRAHPRLHRSPADELVLAADAFIVTPPREMSVNRPNDDAPRTSIIAGYHWFTDWGRDTMISLEGLTLLTGRHEEARGILRMFSNHIRDGLIPNFFSEHEGQGLYHTADATLWFFHALDRYVDLTDDHETLRELLPKLIDVVERHRNVTRFGIGVDPQDGLLRQGAEGYQLTWMDAKIGDWVVTPRRGKAVEINALWYNALQLLAQWVQELQYTGPVPPLSQMAEAARGAFNARFWYGDGGYLYDVVDGEHGDDASCRPNQIFAISLRNPVLDRDRWQPVLDVVQERLLTPVGLRSLSSDHPDYKPKYHGDLRSRDAAYHQGTVWAWLIGPFVDAWIKLYPERRSEARRFLAVLAPHLDEACIGTISEIFDAEPPFTPRGCVAQAWSVAEVLRARWNTSI
jgi:predicted glycogen debranching enzyme